MKNQKPLNVLFLFDKYLNRTMNWAYRLICEMPNIHPHIAAPIIVENEFKNENFKFLRSKYQLSHPKDEWSVPWLDQNIARFTTKVVPLYLRELKRQVADNQIDIIHIHFGNVGADHIDLSIATGIPMVVAFHGYDYETVLYYKPKYRARYKYLFQHVAKIICLGPVGKGLLIDLGCPAEKIEIIHLGIDLKQIDFVERTKQTNTLNLLQVGSFGGKKGHMTTLKAFEKVHKKCPNAKLTLIGERVEIEVYNHVIDFIKKHKLEEKVAVKNIMPYTELLKILPLYDVFIHPSNITKNKNREGCPVGIMDAQASGIPVISTYHSDIPTAVVHEKNGLLAAEKDAAKIATYIERFYKMGNEEYHKFSEAARQHIENEFDMTENAKLTKALYQQILNS